MKVSDVYPEVLEVSIQVLYVSPKVSDVNTEVPYVSPNILDVNTEVSYVSIKVLYVNTELLHVYTETVGDYPQDIAKPMKFICEFLQLWMNPPLRRKHSTDVK